MTGQIETAREDLAFLRGLVESGSDWQRRLGEGYFAAGLCYGVQVLLHLGQFLGVMPSEGPAALAIGGGPTVVFLGLMIWLSMRRGPRPGEGVVARAVAAVFAAFGLSNFALIAIIGSQAMRMKSLEIWLIYPCVVLALQGAAWMIVYALRKRAWIAIVSALWFADGVIMGFSIGHPLPFMLATGFGLFGLMVGPGLYMMRQPRGA